MEPRTTERLKVVGGLLLGFGIGAGCRLLEIPSPAPPVLAGALLVVAMTLGYVGADHFLANRKARHEHLCGGPDGTTKSRVRQRQP
jgi:XapX domain-containing protein